MQVNMLGAKSQLSKLVKAALEGDEVNIANKGVPAVRLVPVDAAPPRRKPGAWAHLAAKTDADAFSKSADRDVANALAKSALSRPKSRVHKA
jgi:prevent-host-death family protein